MGLINSVEGKSRKDADAARREADTKAYAEQRRRKDEQYRRKNEEWNRSRRYLAESSAELKKAIKEQKFEPTATRERLARGKAALAYSERVRGQSRTAETKKRKGKI